MPLILDSNKTWNGQNPRYFQILDPSQNLQVLVEKITETGVAHIKENLAKYPSFTAKVNYLKTVAGDQLIALKQGLDCALFGTVVGTSVFYYQQQGHHFAAGDDAAVLAKRLGLRVSLQRVLLGLIDALPPYPFSLIPLWQDLEQVGPGQVLVFEAGKVRLERYWQPSTATRSGAGLAGQLGATLNNQFAPLKDSPYEISCDLSGGLDSAANAYLLARNGINFSAFHAPSVNPWNEDQKTAQQIADDLQVRLTILAPLASGAKAFTVQRGKLDRGKMPDRPIIWGSTSGYVSELLESFQPGKGRLHFTGLGGDELFTPMQAQAWSLHREHPWRSRRQIKRYAKAMRYQEKEFYRQIQDRTTYSEALERLSENILHPHPGSSYIEGLWFAPASVSKLISKSGQELLATFFGNFDAGAYAPLHPDRSKHQMLESLLFQGQIIRQLNHLHANNLRWISPFLRREVLTVVLQASCRTRSATTLHKPLLALSLKGQMPSELFEKTHSGEYSADTYAEFASHKNALRNQLLNGHLVNYGLIETEYLDQILTRPALSPQEISRLETLVAVENWLNRAHALGFEMTV